MKSARYIRPSHIFGAIVVIGLFSFCLWLLNGTENKSEEGPQQPPTSSAPTSESSSVPTPSEPAVPTEQLEAIEPAVQNFVDAYYSRDASLTEEVFLDRLRPLVTAEFLQQYPLDLSTESDEWVRQQDGVITPSVTIRPSGVQPDHVVVPVDITVTGTSDAQVEPPYTFSVGLDMVWRNEWKVTAII